MRFSVKLFRHGTGEASPQEQAGIDFNLKSLLLAGLLTLLLLLITFTLFSAWRSQYVQDRQQRAQMELLTIRKNLFLFLGNQEMFTLLYGLRLEELMQEGAVPSLSDVSSYLTVLASERQSFSFATLAENGVVIDQYPVEGGRSIGFDLKTLPLYREHFEHLMRQEKVVIDGPIYLENGKPYLVYRYPLLVENKQAWGLLSLYFEMDTFLEGAGLLDLSDSYRYRFNFSHLGSDDAYLWGEEIPREEDPLSLMISYSLLTWEMQIAPKDRWSSGQPILLVYGVLGILVSIASGVLSYRRQVHLKHYKLRSVTDGLTGLLNKREFLVRLQQELREKQGFALALLDIDNFKLLNDTHGHLNGDKALLTLVATLKQNLRRDDIVGRFGGDEFVVFLRGCKECETCKRIFSAISETTMPMQKESTKIGVSMGVAFYPQDGTSSEELLEMADIRLYRAKSMGKGRLVCRETTEKSRTTEA